jgi:predicted Zn-dependent protease
MMKKIFSKLAIHWLAAAVLLSMALGCQTAPVTGRQQLILIPPAQEIALGLQSYRDILKESKLSQDKATVDMVNRVGWDIARVVDRDFPISKDYNWEFSVIEDEKTPNAFALPGGKIAVYTGILKYTQNEAGLATVMAHEVSHALARHGGERMTQALLASVGAVALNVAIQDKSTEAKRAINTAYGAGATVGVLLPFSRLEESEADHIGLVLMAKAGYDPREAIRFWERMGQAGGKKPPAFLSTHPTDQKRIAQIKGWIPEALAYYKP